MTKGFTLSLRGEAWRNRDDRTAWALPSMVVAVDADLEEAVRDREAWNRVALAIGQAIMERGVRVAARGARQWDRMTPTTTKRDAKAKARARMTSFRTSSKP